MSKSKRQPNVVERLIAVFGTQTRLAAAANDQFPQAVTRWKKSGKVPQNHCEAIERACNGRITRYEMRPDIYGEAPQ